MLVHGEESYASVDTSLLNKEADVEDSSHCFDNSIHSLDWCQNYEGWWSAWIGTPYSSQKTGRPWINTDELEDTGRIVVLVLSENLWL